LPARLPTVSIPEVQDLGQVQSMLAERVIEWTEQWKAEGLRQGREQGLQEGWQQGLQQGLAAERALLLRQTQRRFGEACAQALAPLLEGRDNPRAVDGGRRVDHHR
jgi:flagellar biosynthesis/type III secretory pathway protein FliH